MHLNCRMAIVRPPPPTVPPTALPLLTMGSIRIVGQIIVRRHRHLLTSPLRAIGVNRQFNPHMHVPMPPVRPHRSTPPGAVPDNVLPVYRVPQPAPLDRPTTSPAIALLLVVCAVGTGRHHNCRCTRPQALRAETVATLLPPLRLPANRPRVPITAIPRPRPHPLPSVALPNPVRRPYMHQVHVQQDLRHCHRACQPRRSACHVMIASCWNHSPTMLPFEAADSKIDYVGPSPSVLLTPSWRRSRYPQRLRLRLLHRSPAKLQVCKATQRMPAILVPRPQNRPRKSVQHCSIPASMRRRTTYPFPPPCPLLPWSFVS